MPKKPPKFYVVWKGIKPGIYTSWDDCRAQVMAFQGAAYKGFATIEEAEKAFVNGRQAGTAIKPDKSAVAHKYSSNAKPVLPSMSVDAACAGNPGKLEYRGVDTADSKEIFKMGPFPMGTNNIGEFLAIVHGLALLKKNGLDYPVYSDSLTARKWVKDKKIKTNLERNSKTESLFDLVDRALLWLQSNTFSNPILVWDTVHWGEIPADFGRK